VPPPVSTQASVPVQNRPSSPQTTGVPCWQAPATQDSAPLHQLPSSHCASLVQYSVSQMPMMCRIR